MRILVHYAKVNNTYYLADTFERTKAAMRQLFQLLDDGGYDAEDVFAARAGDINAIARILTRRQSFEYEGWGFEEAIDPCIS